MGSKGFKVEYKILDKTPIGLIYWTYYELSPTFIKLRGHSSQFNACSSGNITNIKDLLSEIQD